MADATALLFPHDFAAPPAIAPQEKAPPPLTEGDLAAAREAGWQDGEQAGRTAALSAQSARAAEALTAIAQHLRDAQEAALAAAEANATALADVVIQTLATAFPTLADRYGADEIRRVIDLVRTALEQSADPEIRVHPSLADVVAEAVAPLRRPPRILPDAAIAPGDITIDWQDGGAARAAAPLWPKLMAALQPIGE